MNLTRVESYLVFLPKRCKLYTKDLSYYFCVYRGLLFLLLTSDTCPREGYILAQRSARHLCSLHGSKDNGTCCPEPISRALSRVTASFFFQLKTRLAGRHVQRDGAVSSQSHGSIVHVSWATDGDSYESCGVIIWRVFNIAKIKKIHLCFLSLNIQYSPMNIKLKQMSRVGMLLT